MPSRTRNGKFQYLVKTYYAAAELPTSRADALQAGFSIFLGKPCHSGHTGIRYAQNGQCTECLNHTERQLQVALKVAPPEVVALWDECAEKAHPGNSYKARITKRYLARHWMRANAELIRTVLAAPKPVYTAGPEDFDNLEGAYREDA